MEKTIIVQKVSFDERGSYLETKYKDQNGRVYIQVEPISSEAASLIHAQNGGY